MSIHIVTDSTCDLPREYIDEYNINIVPLNIHFGDKIYKDGIDIDTSKFYQMLEESFDHPSTSQPSPGEFIRLYESIASRGDKVISIHISSELSGTYQSAVMASEMVDEFEVYVIDSRITCTSMGMLVLEAAKMAKEGKEAGEILNRIDDLKKRIYTFFMVNTLEYLEKGGRIGKAQALLGNLLSIKPVLALEEGIVVPVKKARGRNKGLKSILSLAEEKFENNEVNIAVMHANISHEADKLEEDVRGKFIYNIILRSQLGSVIGIHAGPGTVGIGIYSV